MTLSRLLAFLFLLLGGTAFALVDTAPEWGFFGHRRINRLAVFTLDPEMMPFFRDHLEWVTEHAVDPDKRRYATKHEAVRHYIDLDHWGEMPFRNVPLDWADALLWKSSIHLATARDTTVWRVDTITHESPERLFWANSRVQLTDGRQRVEVQLGALRSFWYNNAQPNYYEEEMTLSPDSLVFLPGAGAGAKFPIQKAWLTETFSEYGILPYHLLSYHKRLTQAFASGDPDYILRIAAEMGHYVGDAHVPLHTTENYNGQMTGQTGIHGFWESRLPELFADTEYDYFVGKARYIEDPKQYYWDIVMDSHVLVDSVLSSERRLRETFPVDQQMCYDERSGREILQPCAEFSAAWSDEMQGMVEERFRAAILSVGSVWYSCWVDAGQPDLTSLAPSAEVLAGADTLSAVRMTQGRLHE